MTVLNLLQTLVKKRMKNDPAHDFEHIMRVYKNAKKLCKKEQANEKLVLSAVLLHDIVSYPKSDRRSKNSSCWVPGYTPTTRQALIRVMGSAVWHW